MHGTMTVIANQLLVSTGFLALFKSRLSIHDWMNARKKKRSVVERFLAYFEDRFWLSLVYLFQV